MDIKVKFFTSLREITGKKEEGIQIPSKLTVDEFLIHLSKEYGREFKEYLYDENGNVQKYIHILINGIAVSSLQGFETKLKEKDIIAILPPVGGG